MKISASESQRDRPLLSGPRQGQAWDGQEAHPQIRKLCVVQYLKSPSPEQGRERREQKEEQGSDPGGAAPGVPHPWQGGARQHEQEERAMRSDFLSAVL